MTGLEHYQPRKWISVSSLVAFARCPRRFFYSSGCRLQAGEPHPALKFGECIHMAIPVLMTKGLAPAIEEFTKAWGDNDSLGDDKRNLSRAKLMLADMSVNFNQKTSNGIYQLLDPSQTLKTAALAEGSAFAIADRQSPYEIPFAIDIGLDVPLAGRIDGIAKHRDSGELWGVEYKTASEVSARFLSAFTLSPQICAYTLVLKTITKENVRGCMVTAALVNKTRTGTTTVPVYVGDHNLEDFVKWARWVGGMMLHCEKIGEFPKQFTGCNPYSMFAQPGYVCDYMNLCQVEDWTTLKAMYQVREDKPFTLPSPTVKGAEIKVVPHV